MSDFLRRLAPPRSGDTTRAAPLLPSRFEPAAGLPALRPFGHGRGAAEADAAGTDAAKRPDAGPASRGVETAAPARETAAHDPPAARGAWPFDDAGPAARRRAVVTAATAGGADHRAAFAATFAPPLAPAPRTAGAAAEAGSDTTRHTAPRFALPVAPAAPPTAPPRADVRIAHADRPAPAHPRATHPPPLRPETVASRSVADAGQASAPPRRVVQVTIDRIDVHLPRPPAAVPAPPPRQPAAPTTVALADYLRGRRTGAAT